MSFLIFSLKSMLLNHMAASSIVCQCLAVIKVHGTNGSAINAAMT